MTEKIKKIISALVLLSLLGFYFAAPFTVKKADALFGVGDITFNTTVGDIPAYIKDLAGRILSAGLQKLKKRMLTQIQNDLVNWVQNGGEMRFIKDPGKFIKDNIDATAAKEIDRLFLSKNINICSPFKANVRFLVSKPLLLKEESVRCGLGDMMDNLGNFAENFENGGWTAWLKLHETRNTLPGSYLAAAELIGAQVTQSGNTAQAKITAGRGFLDQKKCSQTKTPKYNLSFVISQGPEAGITKNVKITDPVIIQRILDETSKEIYIWTFFWPLTDPTVLMVDTSSIEFTNTGEFTTKDHSPPIEKYHPLTTCSQEETITPGSIIGDQISGVLEKTSIDRILNADDIALLLDAVIDSAVNRAAREGLSYMKSGRGSWTVPQDRRAGAGAGTQQVIGLESSAAISMQNQLIDLQSAAQKLKRDIEKLTKKTDLEKFKQRLSGIAGDLQEDGFLSVGIVGKNLRARSNKDDGLSDIIDRLFDNYDATYLFDEVAGLSEKPEDSSSYYSNFPDKSNFNKESNNPGIYAANMALNQKTADVWQAIANVFSSLSADAPYGTTIQSCKLIDYTLKPGIEEGGDNSPFINADGDNIHWSSKEDSYKKRIKEQAAKLRTGVEDTKQYALSQSALASGKQVEYQSKSESYASLSENSGGIIAELTADIEFVNAELPHIIRYTSLLMDYDRAGQGHNLVQKIKAYHEILGDRKALDKDLKTYYLDLRDAEAATRTDWLAGQRVLAADSDPSVAAKAAEKAAVIEQANAAIDKSWKIIFNSFKEDPLTGDPIIDPTQLGTRVAQAVDAILGRNINGLQAQMEERQSRIGRQQTDISNRLGVFAERKDIRKEIGLEGGDSEWEKYFENRFQLVYAAFIYDFYKNHFVNEMCSNKPAGLESE